MSKKKKIQKFSLMRLVAFLVLALFFIQLVIAYNLATQGEELRELELKTQQLERDNLALADEIGQAGSLSRITKEAEKLGMSKISQILNLTSQIPVALGGVNLSFGQPSSLSSQ
jgi:cell division protein FtsL